jgi:hypothetical protein
MKMSISKMFCFRPIRNTFIEKLQTSWAFERAFSRTVRRQTGMIAGTLNDLIEKTKERVIYYSCFVILFSLSIYLLATNNLTSFDFKIGFVTLSVDSLIVAWGVLFSTFEEKNNKG